MCVSWSDEQPVLALGYPRTVCGPYRRVPFAGSGVGVETCGRTRCACRPSPASTDPQKGRAVKRTWTVELKDGTRVHTGDYDVDVEGGALTFRDVDGDLAHAYGPGHWCEYHLNPRGAK